MTNYEKFHKSLQTNYRDWQAFIDWWAGGKKFTREITYSHIRQIATDTNRLIKSMMYFCDPKNRADLGNPNVWLSVFNYRDIYTEGEGRKRPIYSSADIDKLFFDFDVHKCTGCELDPGTCGFQVEGNKCEGHIVKPRLDIEDLRPVWDEVVPILDEGAHVVFSGRKGFQAHLPLDKLISQIEYKKRQNALQDMWGWEFSDKVVYGDLSRVCRLPFTVHPVSDLQCVLVRQGETLEQVFQRAHQINKPEVIK